MPRVFSVTTIYSPRDASLPEPYSTRRIRVSGTPASSLHPVSPQGTRGRGGPGNGHSSGHRPPKRLEKAFPPQQPPSIRTGLQDSNRHCSGKSCKTQTLGQGTPSFFKATGVTTGSWKTLKPSFNTARPLAR